MPTIYVFSRNMKNIRVFLTENFHFLAVNFSVYLKRRDFVMTNIVLKMLEPLKFDCVIKQRS